MESEPHVEREKCKVNDFNDIVEFMEIFEAFMLKFNDFKDHENYLGYHTGNHEIYNLFWITIIEHLDC